MEIRFENRDSFTVLGYSVESKESSHETDIGLLRDKHEDKLKVMPESVLGLYFVTWPTGKDAYIYHFGIEKQEQTAIDDIATCVEIPAARFAVATVPENKPILEAWAELYETGLLSVKAIPNEEHGIYFEFFNNNGVREIWIPVVQ